MRQLLAIVAVAIACTALDVGCAAVPESGRTMPLEAVRKLPALAWLDENRNPSALASNRFGPTAKAREFVNELFRLGAEQVYVADPMDEERRVKLEGGPYADTLIVSLPKDSAQRAALFRVFAAEARREGFDPERDRGQGQVLLWWD